ncbi:MAG: aconitate hydratase AcnA [Pseudomonadota bacterium]
MAAHPDSFKSRTVLETPAGPVTCFQISRLAEAGFGGIDRLPFSIRILLENLLRNEDGVLVTKADIAHLAAWSPQMAEPREVPFMPARVLLQDFTGVPSVVDLAAMRDAANRLYGTPEKINPRIPAELVIDHSVQVDAYGSADAFDLNEDRDYQRNAERYAFLRWGQGSFKNFKVVPPATGICHQVNLEYLARVVFAAPAGGGRLAFPDTVVGLDSHTTMINGIGVMGWGVGGIEAEAVMLGRPYYLLTPQVVGFRLTGALPAGVTATDLVLTVTEILRKRGVVGKFVEFFGPGLSKLSLEDKATISNMSPEYGATMGFFPVDAKTLDYLRLTGRDEATVALVEAYCKAQGLFRTDEQPDPVFSETVALDMATVVPSLAGPKRPQDRVPLNRMKTAFEASFSEIKVPFKNGVNECSRWESEGGACPEDAPVVDVNAPEVIAAAAKQICHGSVVIAAITSCTNTSNPSVLIGAGLLAKKAVQKGLRAKPWVKTSLAPGSKVVIDYLKSSGLSHYLDKLNFHHVAYGCTTCIGNSGPLPEPIAKAVEDSDLIVASVLSGNRNFEGRINPLTRANYLASPPLVVAYALAGTVLFDFETDALGTDADGKSVFLRDIWPTESEIAALVKTHVKAEMYREDYATVFDGTARWQALPVPEGSLYRWADESTYIKNPPFFEETGPDIPPLADVAGARVLALLGDSVTTDHISPAGAIPLDSPAADYLRANGVSARDFNSFGSRRGNHEVMMRGTFGNIRLKNLLVPGVDGGYTTLLPGGGQMSIYDAAMAYKKKKTPLVVLAGKEYGTGSSRDWAAKGTFLLGVKAVIAESFERIHRSNLVCMGVLPLEFKTGEGHAKLGLTGKETFEISGITDIAPGKMLTVTATDDAGKKTTFTARARLDSPVEVTYYTHGGILNFVLREMAGS